jgi:hypothetical protein
MSRPDPVRASRPKGDALPFLAVHALWGVVLSIGALWAFLAIAEDVPEQARMVRMDVAIASWIEHPRSAMAFSCFCYCSGRRIECGGG